MQKRYQVFVSSTYTDLQEERRAVMQTLLELNAIPAGMELFPASDDEQWEFIQREIDQCDYYVVIVGNKYGSTTESGLSFTEREYNYAVEEGIPVLGFLHEKPGDISMDKSELDPDVRERLEAFREKVTGKKLCKFWNTADELALRVSHSLSRVIGISPRPGWVRAGSEGDPAVEAQLRKELDAARRKLASISTLEPPKGIEDLSQGSELFTVHYSRGILEGGVVKLSWDELFTTLGPGLRMGDSESILKVRLERHIYERESFVDLGEVDVRQEDFDKVINQFEAIGLTKTSPEMDGSLAWGLTAYGRNHLIQLSAVRRSE